MILMSLIVMGGFVTYAGRKQLFCSDKCGTAWRRRPENIPHAYEFTCKNCGKTYWQVDKRRNQFCSVPCMNEYHRENQKQKPLKPLKPLNTCVVCGKQFIATRSDVKYCSDECRKQHDRDRFRDFRIRNGHTVSGRVETIICAYCGKVFQRKIVTLVPKYCSKDCGRKANIEAKPELYSQLKRKARQVRRARKYNNGPVDKFNDIDVFNRDGWICYVCGEKINQSIKYPDPMCATLEHIVALANGGTHTLDNVSVSHLKCNIEKSTN